MGLLLHWHLHLLHWHLLLLLHWHLHGHLLLHRYLVGEDIVGHLGWSYVEVGVIHLCDVGVSHEVVTYI